MHAIGTGPCAQPTAAATGRHAINALARLWTRASQRGSSKLLPSFAHRHACLAAAFLAVLQYVAMDLAHGRRFCLPRRLRVTRPACWETGLSSFAGVLDEQAAIAVSKRATNFISAVCRLS